MKTTEKTETTSTFTVRSATREDAPLMVEMARCLASYEKRPEAATASVEDVQHWLFVRKTAEVLLAQWGEETVGYALFYPVYQSFAGRGALHVEDIVLKPSHRGQGFGRKLMAEVAALAVRRGYTGMDWCCLDWNEDAMRFYEALGAQRSLGTVEFGFEEEALHRMAAECPKTSGG